MWDTYTRTSHWYSRALSMGDTATHTLHWHSRPSLCVIHLHVPHTDTVVLRPCLCGPILFKPQLMYHCVGCVDVSHIATYRQLHLSNNHKLQLQPDLSTCDTSAHTTQWYINCGGPVNVVLHYSSWNVSCNECSDDRLACQTQPSVHRRNSRGGAAVEAY